MEHNGNIQYLKGGEKLLCELTHLKNIYYSGVYDINKKIFNCI